MVQNSFIIFVQGSVTNTGSTTYTCLLIDIALAIWTDLFGKCYWQKIPTFGLLDNITMCSSDPIIPGSLHLNTTFNIVPFAKILPYIPNEVSPPLTLYSEYHSFIPKIFCRFR